MFLLKYKNLSNNQLSGEICLNTSSSIESIDISNNWYTNFIIGDFSTYNVGSLKFIWVQLLNFIMKHYWLKIIILYCKELKYFYTKFSINISCNETICNFVEHNFFQNFSSQLLQLSELQEMYVFLYF